jgi:hypothetical protein
MSRHLMSDAAYDAVVRGSGMRSKHKRPKGLYKSVNQFWRPDLDEKRREAERAANVACAGP